MAVDDGRWQRLIVAGVCSFVGGGNVNNYSFAYGGNINNRMKSEDNEERLGTFVKVFKLYQRAVSVPVRTKSYL